jgi:hypothetical protein
MKQLYKSTSRIVLGLALLFSTQKAFSQATVLHTEAAGSWTTYALNDLGAFRKRLVVWPRKFNFTNIYNKLEAMVGLRITSAHTGL